MDDNYALVRLVAEKLSRIPQVVNSWNSWLDAFITSSIVCQSGPIQREVGVDQLPKFRGSNINDFKVLILSIYMDDRLRLLLVGQLLIENRIGSALDVIR